MAAQLIKMVSKLQYGQGIAFWIMVRCVTTYKGLSVAFNLIKPNPVSNWIALYHSFRVFLGADLIAVQKHQFKTLFTDLVKQNHII